MSILPIIASRSLSNKGDSNLNPGSQLRHPFFKMVDSRGRPIDISKFKIFQTHDDHKISKTSIRTNHSKIKFVTFTSASTIAEYRYLFRYGENAWFVYREGPGMNATLCTMESRHGPIWSSCLTWFHDILNSPIIKRAVILGK